jgi:hypothetical protein
MKVVVRFSSSVPARERSALAAWAIEHCPVTDSAARAVPIEVEVG